MNTWYVIGKELGNGVIVISEPYSFDSWPLLALLTRVEEKMSVWKSECVRSWRPS